MVVRKPSSRRTCPSAACRHWLLGLVLGSVVTLTSVGAGAIGVVILTLLYPTLKTRRLIGTDIVHAVPLTLVSGLGHMSIGNTSFELLGLLLAGSLPGIAIGSRLTGILPDWMLRVFLSVILCFAAYSRCGKESELKRAVATLHVMAALRGGHPGQHVEIFHLALDGRVKPRPWSKGKNATSRARSVPAEWSSMPPRLGHSSLHHWSDGSRAQPARGTLFAKRK